MSSSYDSSRSRRRGAWGHWVPLAVTVAVATAGVAVWAWSQRSTEEEEEEQAAPDLDYENADYGDNPAYGASGSTNYGTTGEPSTARAAGSTTYGVTEAREEANLNAGWGMSGALRRSPSPQQFLANAGKTLAAGAGAVGAAMGSALAAIREEDKTAYADHETWSQEAEARRDNPNLPNPTNLPQAPSRQASRNTNRDTSRDTNRESVKETGKETGKRRRTVAVVVSADTNMDDFDEDGFHEHASILSHIPHNTDFSRVKLFVLIYAPGLKENALEAAVASNPRPPSLSSSFSNIGHDQVTTPGEEIKSPSFPKTSPDRAFNAVYSQALSLVEKDSMIMPFTSPNGHVHILRHLQPEIVYLQESLSGDNGGHITQLQTWLRHDVILIVGANGGHGGLADSESGVGEPDEKEDYWWQREERVGRGRGVVVVDSVRVGDDWERRVQGKE
ncbi:hypothetical protein PG985_009385 [Apiospora marii]|uniref:Peroxin 22-like protein n=1 Tax=Apiospora marii TaxID=335849 RepID=A0ABR1RFI6_9PEZI